MVAFGSSRLVAYISNIPAVPQLEYFPDTSGGPDPAPFESNLLSQLTGLVVLRGLPRVGLPDMERSSRVVPVTSSSYFLRQPAQCKESAVAFSLRARVRNL